MTRFGGERAIPAQLDRGSSPGLTPPSPPAFDDDFLSVDMIRCQSSASCNSLDSDLTAHCSDMTPPASPSAQLDPPGPDPRTGPDWLGRLQPHLFASTQARPCPPRPAGSPRLTRVALNPPSSFPVPCGAAVQHGRLKCIVPYPIHAGQPISPAFHCTERAPGNPSNSS